MEPLLQAFLKQRAATIGAAPMHAHRSFAEELLPVFDPESQPQAHQITRAENTDAPRLESIAWPAQQQQAHLIAQQWRLPAFWKEFPQFTHARQLWLLAGWRIRLHFFFARALPGVRDTTELRVQRHIQCQRP